MTEKIKPFRDVGGYTSFPNAAIDHIMPNCKPNTWKLLCAIIRKTIGWHKRRDIISFSQLQDITGMISRETLLVALDDAVKEGYIIKIPYENTFKYEINKQYEILDTQYENRTGDGTENEHTKESIKDINKDTGVSLYPETEGQNILFELLAVEARAKGRKRPIRFPSVECKKSFAEAEIRLGSSHLNNAIRAALRNGITAVSKITAYVNKYQPNKFKKEQGSTKLQRNLERLGIDEY